jgi:hypothetical protein
MILPLSNGTLTRITQAHGLKDYLGDIRNVLYFILMMPSGFPKTILADPWNEKYRKSFACPIGSLSPINTWQIMPKDLIHRF